jgi:hypothetical protein
MLQDVITAMSGLVAAIAWPVTLLAFAVSTAVVMAGWRRRQDMLQRQGRPIITDRIELGQTPFAAGVLDVAAETTAVLRRFESLAALRFVALEFAVHPELAVRTDARALREILGDLVGQAIDQPFCKRVLLGAIRVGGQVHITVSDDGAQADRALRASQLRSAERLAALQGATLEVDTQAGQGATVLLRLPSGAIGRHLGGEAEKLDPASVWAPAGRVPESTRVGR